MSNEKNNTKKSSNITLEKILENEKIKEAYITYRFFFKGSDELYGICEYRDGKLKSLDGDTYSLKDEVIKYEIDNETFADEIVNLIIWIPVILERT